MEATKNYNLYKLPKDYYYAEQAPEDYYFYKKIDKTLEEESKHSTVKTILTFAFFTAVLNALLNDAFNSDRHTPIGKRDYNYFRTAYKKRIEAEGKLYKKEILDLSKNAYRFALSRNFYYRALKDGWTHIIWLHTVSSKPREKHLMNVGKLIKITKTRIELGKLPGLAYNCKCGVRLIRGKK